MFETELEMQKAFINFLNKEKKKNQNIFEEFNARFGNVDVVVSELDDSKIKINIEQAEVLSNYSAALVLAFLHKKKPHKFEYLLDKTGYTSDYLSSILAIMKKEHIIYEIEHKFIVCEDFKFPNLKFTSYELKLKQWKKAVLQAMKNKNFAYNSFVVMPNNIAERLFKNNYNIFKEYNIGLVGIDYNSCNYYIKPHSNIHSFSINPIFISSIAKYLLLEKAKQ